MKRNKLVFEIVEEEDMLCLNLNGDLCQGYMKPLQKNREDIMEGWLEYIKNYNGILKSK